MPQTLLSSTFQSFPCKRGGVISSDLWAALAASQQVRLYIPIEQPGVQNTHSRQAAVLTASFGDISPYPLLETAQKEQNSMAFHNS